MFQRLCYVMFSVPCYPGCSILSTTNFLVEGHFTCWFPACPNRENLFTLSHPSPCQLKAHLLPGEHSLQQAGYHQASLYLKELKMNCRRTSKVLSFSKSFLVHNGFSTIVSALQNALSFNKDSLHGVLCRENKSKSLAPLSCLVGQLRICVSMKLHYSIVNAHLINHIIIFEYLNPLHLMLICCKTLLSSLVIITEE